MGQGADVVLRAGTKDLAESAAYASNRATGGKYRIALPEGGGEPFRLYDGKERFLVRTALIRNESHHGGNAPILNTPRLVAKLCRHLTAMDQEYMVTVAVDVRSHLVAIHEVAIGAISGLGVAARDIVKIPLLCGAPAGFIVHNHPSGKPDPSPEDLAMTKAVERAAGCVGVTLLDHIIVATGGWMSLLMDTAETW